MKFYSYLENPKRWYRILKKILWNPHVSQEAKIFFKKYISAYLSRLMKRESEIIQVKSYKILHKIR